MCVAQTGWAELLCLLGPAEDPVILGGPGSLVSALKTYLGAMQGPAQGLWFVQGTQGVVGLAAAPSSKGFRLNDHPWWSRSRSRCPSSLWELPDGQAESNGAQGWAVKQGTEDAARVRG